MLNVALSSQSLHSLSEPLIYHIITFSFTLNNRDSNRSLIRRLLNNSDLRVNVREIRVIWGPSAPSTGDGMEDLQLVANLIPELTRLAVLV